MINRDNHMLLGKLILCISALVLIAYGIVSLVDPAIPSGLAGLVINSGDGYAEITSMYGGLQIGFGLFCAMAALKPEFYRAGLALLVIAIGAVALARTLGVLITKEAVTSYTWGALIYECTTASIAALALSKSKKPIQPE